MFYTKRLNQLTEDVNELVERVNNLSARMHEQNKEIDHLYALIVNMK